MDTRIFALGTRSVLAIVVSYLLCGITSVGLASSSSEEDFEAALQKILTMPMPDSDELPEKKEREVEECGVIPKSLAQHPCPVKTWKAKRSEHCPPELFNEKKSRDCPGHVSKHHKSRHCDLTKVTSPCSGEFEETKFWKSDHQSRARGCGNGSYLFNWICEKIPTCRMEEFGVFKWQLCEHKKHGPETWESCRHPSFKKDKDKKCEIMMTHKEIAKFMAGVETAMEPWEIILAGNRGSFMGLKQDTKDLACLIKRYEAANKYRLLVKELKDLYDAKAGEPYEPPSQEFCNDAGDSEKIPTPEELECQEDENTGACKIVRRYHLADKWFSVRITYIAKLVDDLWVRSKYDKRASKKDDLIKLGEKLEATYKDAR